MVRSSLATSTRKSYRRFLDRFKDFATSKKQKLQFLPASASTVALFITYLHSNGYSASTICSHLSAISFHHKLSGNPDPCQSFLVQRMILGCKKGCISSDTRLPILKPMLHQLVVSCNQLDGAYDQALFQSLLLFTYHGFFRIGEILPYKQANSKKVNQINHIQISSSSMLIKLHNYKTRRSQKPLLITIKASKSKFCPVKALQQFLRLRGNISGPLFLQLDGKPLLTSHFNRVFKTLLSWRNLPSKVYKAHSLHIGACTNAIISGIPERVVMDLGRWKSYSAFKWYVRLQNT